MKAQHRKTARKKRLFFISGTLLGIICLSATLLVWFAPESWPGVYARDQWLIHTIEQHQRSDGFFIFGNDLHPQLIAETYLSVVTLNGLSADIPNKGYLQASLTNVEEAAHNALLQGKPVLGPRDIYELLMIHRLAAIPVDLSLLTGYLSRMSDLLTRQNQQEFSNSVHDWYYALQVLILSNRITPPLRQQTEITIFAHLAATPTSIPPLIETALLIDVSTLLGIHLSTETEQHARLLLWQCWSAIGGFRVGQTPDILSTYFAVILAHEIGSENQFQSGTILHWLAMQRVWDGYNSSAAIKILATGYAILLRNILHGELINTAPR